MKLSHKSQQLWDLIAPAVKACGVELWGVEFAPHGKQSMLRVYIDRPDVASTAQGIDAPVSVEELLATIPEDAEDTGRGIGVEDCVAVNQQVGALLDVHNPIAGEYTLEVSSPGWDRTFYTIEQMEAYVGQTVAIRLISPVNNQRKFTGRLVSVVGQEVSLTVPNHELLVVNSQNIDKANLVYQD